jgi:hypothetical protein
MQIIIIIIIIVIVVVIIIIIIIINYEFTHFERACLVVFYPLSLSVWKATLKYSF